MQEKIGNVTLDYEYYPGAPAVPMFNITQARICTAMVLWKKNSWKLRKIIRRRN